MKFSIAILIAVSIFSGSALADASKKKKNDSNRKATARPNASKGKAGKTSKKSAPPSIRIGQDLDDALKVMSKLGNGNVPESKKKGPPKNLEFKRWVIGDGFLFVVFSGKEKKITGLFYSVPAASDSKEKKKRYRYRVKSYSPKTGEMKLYVPNKLSDKEPAERQPPNFF